MKRWAAGLVALVMAVSFAGCSGADDVLSAAGTAMKAQGREFGQTITLEQEDTMQTAFFALRVNSVVAADERDGFIPDDETHQFLVVNVTIENTFDHDASIPMSEDDFELTWEALEGETIFPESEFAQGQLPAEYQIFKGDSRTGDLIFVVPKDVKAYDLKYYDLYEDDFEGNTFFMRLTV